MLAPKSSESKIIREGEGSIVHYAAARLNLLHMLPEFLESHGVSPDAIFKSVGVGSLSEVAQGAVVSQSQVFAALQASSRSVGLPQLGLHLGEKADPIKLGAPGCALVGGRTLLDGLRAHARLMPRIQADSDVSLEIVDGVAVWTQAMRLPWGEGLYLLYEGASAFMCRTIRTLVGEDWRPLRLSFPHPCYGRASVYEEFFGAPVVFGTGRRAEIRFDAEALARPVAQPSGAGLFGLDEHGLSGARPSDARVLAAVETMVESHVGHGGIGLPEVAQTLGMPVRSLQRRLKTQGATFEDVLDRHRRAHAEEMVRAGQSNLTTIAMALGYSDSSHFVRAFRRWTGRTPSTFARDAQ